MYDEHTIEEGGFDFDGFTAHIANFLKDLLDLFKRIGDFFSNLTSDDDAE